MIKIICFGKLKENYLRVRVFDTLDLAETYFDNISTENS